VSNLAGVTEPQASGAQGAMLSWKEQKSGASLKHLGAKERTRRHSRRQLNCRRSSALEADSDFRAEASLANPLTPGGASDKKEAIMRVLNCSEVETVSGANTDYGPIVACTIMGTVGIAFGFLTGGPIGGGLAYMGALAFCNTLE
jgi:hypothetical protein